MSRIIRAALPAVMGLAVLAACGQATGQLQRYGALGHVAVGEAAATEAQTGFATDDTDRTGWLIGPNFSLVVNGFTVTETVEATQASVFGYDGAAPVYASVGTEFFAAYIDSATVVDVPDLAASLIVDDVETPLERLPVDGQTIAAVVPVDAEVTLAVTDEGRTQRLNLRDGDRTADVAGFYIGGPESADPDDYDERGTVTAEAGSAYLPAQREVGITMAVGAAHRSPWSTEHGWAAEGNVWISVPVSRMATDAVWGFDTSDGSHEPKLYWRLSETELFSLAPVDGDPVAAVGEETFVVDESADYTGSTETEFTPGEIRLWFEVPEDTVTANLRITPSGQLTAEWADATGSGSWDVEPGSGEITLTFR